MRLPWDKQWGTSTESGNWTGIVGTLQYHEADFSQMLSWMLERKKVLDYSRIYASEPLNVITIKPQPLPRSLSLVRPLSGIFLTFVSICLFFFGKKNSLPKCQDELV